MAVEVNARCLLSLYQAVVFPKQKSVLPFPFPTVFSLLISSSFPPHPKLPPHPPLDFPFPPPEALVPPTAFSAPFSSVIAVWSVTAAHLSSPRSDAEGITNCFQLALSDGYNLLLPRYPSPPTISGPQPVPVKPGQDPEPEVDAGERDCVPTASDLMESSCPQRHLSLSHRGPPGSGCCPPGCTPGPFC